MFGRGYQYAGGTSFGPPITPLVIKQLLIANGAIYLAQRAFPWIERIGAIRPQAVWEDGSLWQPFTYMFLHSSYDPFHLIFNLLALWMFGSPLALAWGEARFLRFYLFCGVGAGFVIATFPALPVLFGLGVPASYILPTLGASGAIYGVLLAFSLTWPNRTIMLMFPPIPLRALYFIPFLFFWGLLFGPPNVSHIGHLGGVLVGWLWLRRGGGTGNHRLLPTLSEIRYRWHRYRMRRRLHAVRREEVEERERARRNDDHTIH